MDIIQTPDFLDVAQKLKGDARRFARVYCLQWFDDSFQNQGFTDSTYVAWDKRKNPDKRPGGAILTNTTFLRRSLAVLSENESSMQFGTPVQYAIVHNSGLRVRAIQNVRGYHNKNFMGTGKRVQIRPHMRKMDAKYPQRQFIGHSQQMMLGLNDWIMTEIQKRFNQQ